MDVPMNADVYCTNGSCGKITCVIVNPIKEEITHIVVREKKAPYTEFLVPYGYLLETTPDKITLRCSQEELAGMEVFFRYRFIMVNTPYMGYPSQGVMAWPYAIADEEVFNLVKTEERIPPGKLAIHRGSHVHATDGKVGKVDEFLVDPADGHITHLVLREGHLWGQKDVVIPVAQIDHLVEDDVHLNIDKNSVESLPAIRVHHLF